MDYYKRALELNEDTVANRRYIHTHAEIGLELPVTTEYVIQKLREYGLEPKRCGNGVMAMIGRPGRTILLRADMDALPMAEESGEPFACPTGKAAHTCGHDFHAAMLLTAARMLKESEDSLQGTVKLMFQPAEETFQGCKDMIAQGILKDPVPDAALAYHVALGRMPVGLYMYNAKDTMMYSVDGFQITVQGKGSHGAYPHAGIDPINIAVHIYLALQELIARESDPTHSCVLTIGQFRAGTAANIIPETALLQGTIRTNQPEARELLVRRMKEVAERTAAVYNGSVEIEMLSEVPPLICDPVLTKQMTGYMEELSIPGLTPVPDCSASASEDFAVVAEKIPSAYMYLSAGYQDARGDYPAHHPKAQFNEEVCPIGAACLAQCASRWLQEHAGE